MFPRETNLESLRLPSSVMPRPKYPETDYSKKKKKMERGAVQCMYGSKTVARRIIGPFVFDVRTSNPPLVPKEICATLGFSGLVLQGTTSVRIISWGHSKKLTVMLQLGQNRTQTITIVGAKCLV